MPRGDSGAKRAIKKHDKDHQPQRRVREFKSRDRRDEHEEDGDESTSDRQQHPRQP